MDYRQKIDYSSLSTYIECPRKFLFKYIFHFRGRKNINPVFGGCYHYGLEQVYKELIKNPKLSVLDATQLATDSFNALWAIEGASNWPNQDMIFPKSPGHAANMYNEYWKRFLALDQNDKRIIAVEESFSIDLAQLYPGLPNYIGRIDLTWEGLKKDLLICDHKTSKALYLISLPSYEMSFQTYGYLAAGLMFYDKIASMIYNIHLCQKSKIDFHRYTLYKSKAGIEQFLQDLVYFVKLLLIDLEIFDHEITKNLKRNDHIKAFRRRPGSACTTYMSPCSYMDLCQIRNNPLLWHNNPPQGWTINEWDPDKHDAELREKLLKAKEK